MKITRNQAIKIARKNVSTLSKFGDSYKYATYIHQFDAWRESSPREYYHAQSHRSQNMIDIARDAMGLDAVQYDGGSWTDYV
jgi:hypothetical protein